MVQWLGWYPPSFGPGPSFCQTHQLQPLCPRSWSHWNISSLPPSNAMNRLSLRRLFSACDVNKSGRIEYEDFTVVCRELNVPDTETRTLFDKFGARDDGFIDYDRFSSRFLEVSETLDLASFGAGTSHTRGGDFVDRVDADFLLSER